MGKAEIRFEIFPKRLFGTILWWNWRIRNTENGKILGGSTGQNYSRKSDAFHTASLIARYASVAGVIEVEK